VQSLVQLVVALEILLIPAWVAAVGVSPPGSMRRRLVRGLVPVAAIGVAVVVLGAIGGEGLAWGAVKSQAVAVGFAVLVAGLAQAGERVLGARAGQATAAIVGWLIVGGVILAGPVAELTEGPVRATAAQVAVGASPLVMAEQELGGSWLHANLTYVLTPIGESYSYLLADLAWWKTALWHVFIGSGLLVFSLRRGRRSTARDVSEPRP
jgi:hypothetical protein